MPGHLTQEEIGRPSNAEVLRMPDAQPVTCVKVQAEIEEDRIPQSVNLREAEGEASPYEGNGLLDLAMIADGEVPSMRIYA